MGNVLKLIFATIGAVFAAILAVMGFGGDMEPIIGAAGWSVVLLWNIAAIIETVGDITVRKT